MLSILLSVALPLTLMLIGCAPLYLFVIYWKHTADKRSRESPLVRDMLRPPGHSLRLAIDEIDGEIDMLIVAVFLIPLFGYCGHISQSYFGHEPETTFRTASSVSAAVIFLGVVCVKLKRRFFRRRALKAGLEGELSTAEDLNQLMLDGCRVFHDVPSGDFTIDHVVVSRSGVFAVNSKSRGKPKSGEDRAKATVDYNANVIQFPDGTFRIPLNQLEAERNWLAKTLTSSTGSEVSVESVLAFPGWFIENRIGKRTVRVINPRNSRSQFVTDNTSLSPKVIEQIAHQLDVLCRDVRPSFKPKKSLK